MRISLCLLTVTRKRLAETSVATFLTFLASKPEIALGCPVLSKTIKTQVFMFHNGQSLLGIHNYTTIVGLVITLAECTCWLPFLLTIMDVGPPICTCVK